MGKKVVLSNGAPIHSYGLGTFMIILNKCRGITNMVGVVSYCLNVLLRSSFGNVFLGFFVQDCKLLEH